MCIYITGGSTIGAQSVYHMELLAIVGALQLAANIKISLDAIVTDALGCCQITNRWRRHLHLTNNYIGLMGPLQQHY